MCVVDIHRPDWGSQGPSLSTSMVTLPSSTSPYYNINIVRTGIEVNYVRTAGLPARIDGRFNSVT